MLSLLFHRFKSIAFAASLIFTVLLISAYALPTVRAADIVIDDGPSCVAAGGVLNGNDCVFSDHFTLAAGDTLTSSLRPDFRAGFTNNGNITLYRGLEFSGSSTVNHGMITFNGGVIRQQSDNTVNYGTITSNISYLNWLAAGIFTNYGTINGSFNNRDTVINECPGVINGTVHDDGGIYINNCPPTNTPTNTLIPPSATFTPTPSNTSTNTATPTASNTATKTPTPTASNTATFTPTNTATLTPSNTPTNTFTPTPSGFAKAQFNHGNEISVTKSERPSIIFQYGSTTGLPLSNPRLECAISGQATFVTPVGNNGFTTVTATATSFTLSGRAPLKNGQNYTATFKVNPGATVGQISTLTCTLLGDNFAAVSDTLNIRVR